MLYRGGSCAIYTDPVCGHGLIIRLGTFNRNVLTFKSGTLSFSGEIIAKISFVKTGGAPGSVEGVVPNSKLQTHINNYLTYMALYTSAIFFSVYAQYATARTIEKCYICSY